MNFNELGLSPEVLQAVIDAGYTTPTPIQQKAIPVVASGRDVLGCAQTGTGRTAAFALPMIDKLAAGRARARMPRSLILEPTRELAAQVAEHFEILGRSHKLTVALLIGGVSYDDQDRKLDRGADVVIATPGRLLDHFERGKLLLNGIEILVVDEADRMLDMGFIPDIERICKLLPFTRQTLFFSATMPPEIQRLADKFLHSPERMEVAPQATAAATIVQRLKKAPDDPAGKREALRALMREIDVKNAIIFCNRKKDVGILYRSLLRHGFSVGALHGDLDQHQRTATLDAFRNGTIAFLAASDVAARGLDIPEVSHIFNYDVPIHPEDYIHRIGRTGRAGREGFAAMLVTPRDIKALKAIEKMLKQEIPWIDGAHAPSEASEGSDSRTNGRHRRGGRSRRNKGPSSSKAPHAPRTQAAPAPHPPRHEVPHAPRAAAPVHGNGSDAKRDERRSDPHRHGEQRRDQQHKPHQYGDRKPTPGAQAAASSERPAPTSKAPQLQAARPKQQGMGDHVPAFMMRPVRVT
jgi:superfamily II DNA/RNA helicase